MNTAAGIRVTSLQCTVCTTQNDDFAIICRSCGRFLQGRVANLDFFTTVWSLIESPRVAFRRIVLSEQKNYVISMMVFLGIGMMFVLLSLRHAGSEFDNLLFLMLYGIVLGVVGGIPLGVAFAAVMHAGCRLWKGKAAFRNTFAVVGWSLVPVVLSVVILMPIELASMGMLLFTPHPTAAVVKPVVYYTLAGLDVVVVLWTVGLAGYGCATAHRLPLWKTLLTAVLVAVVLSISVYGACARWII